MEGFAQDLDQEEEPLCRNIDATVNWMVRYGGCCSDKKEGLIISRICIQTAKTPVT
jgi:hypothetical protein